MKLICTLPARNEDWCIALTARAALLACDELVVLDHASTDNTLEILEEISTEHPGRVRILHDYDPVWKECRHRQAMLDAARARRATHVALIDADEILTGNFVTDGHWIFKETIKRARGNILQLPWICLARSIERRYTTGVWGENNVSCAFTDSPRCHWTAQDGYDFHHRHPMGHPLTFTRPMQHDAGGLMHLQFVSERRLKAKQAAYKMQEVLRWPGRESVDVVNARYNRAVYESLVEEQPLEVVPAVWWEPYAAWMKCLDLSESAEPWQERQCKAWMAEHGAARFKGLDLFGVC